MQYQRNITQSIISLTLLQIYKLKSKYIKFTILCFKKQLGKLIQISHSFICVLGYDCSKSKQLKKLSYCWYKSVIKNIKPFSRYQLKELGQSWEFNVQLLKKEAERQLHKLFNKGSKKAIQSSSCIIKESSLKQEASY
ncbi:hypothetical protein TTHERM_000658788 (macronuclear) [Tetrahymena thermophila SB210]|uniref:Uncharacterized protein n=1 Tax=Tetrahymena thermophila (strain SB210) TaxID=312017 RepID=W7WYQ9_TETTS|nr:hypothetical protein TTHERM_000658788 [Tetrahymena thermophila SB210]EWS72030.1 hypothetical protein TTHERM_000658788 [Tetrahymena thermophila SB210]|eukprot:XP_012655437.1 hypothetical protein TTHERM_000658788 [Tetrahymena thermophila SB210]